MKFRSCNYAILSLVLVCSMFSSVWAATEFTNMGSIVNTKHNLSQSSVPSATQAKMDPYRNDYGEVCVYCHTPHGSNLASTVPLWNRTMKDTTYNTYNNLGTPMTQTVRQPGGSSKSCLSCHDGQTAIDSIINMPGAFRNQGGAGAQANQYTLSGINDTMIQATGPQAGQPTAAAQTYYKLSAKFLDTWTNSTTYGDGSVRTQFVAGATNHAGMNSALQQVAGGGNLAGKTLGPVAGAFGMTTDIGCMTCHGSNGNSYTAGVNHSMDLPWIGTDLRNDHPVGVTFPTTNGTGTDWKTPSGTGKSGMKYFDSGTITGQLDKADIRIYGAGFGGADGAPSATVECASCHDPHGVPDPTTGFFKKTFLRVSNTGSAVCLTCHTK